MAAVFVIGCSPEPSKDMVTEALKPILPQNYSVSSVEKCKAVTGLYEVVVVIDKQPTILYIDQNLKHVVSGSIVEIASKKNLTYETQTKIKSAGQPQTTAQQVPVLPQKAK